MLMTVGDTPIMLVAADAVDSLPMPVFSACAASFDGTVCRK
ncbi:hypothetical protein [Undibacterium sp. KW1]|nr:hypothetical protein [Undibacterium sp. KW1]